MMRQDFTRRLTYLPGGGLSVAAGPWPSDTGPEWWEPTTGSFTVVAVYQPKGAASLAASYTNLANPGTYDAAAGTAPTFDTSTGWTFNGSTQYLTTGISAGQNWTAIARFSDGTVVANKGLFGTDSSTNRRFYLWPILGNDEHVAGAGGYAIHATPGVDLTDGVMAVAGRQCYINGTSHSTQTNAAYSGDAEWPLLIGAIASAASGAASLFWNGKIQAIAVYSTTLDATQISEITTNINAL